MANPNYIRIAIPRVTYEKTLQFAEHIDCISETGNPVPSSAVRKALKVVLNFYNDEDFQKCVHQEGGDTLSYIQKCVRKNMKEVLGK